MKGRISKKLLSIGLSLALCATAVPMVSLTSSAAGTATPKVATGQYHTVVLKSDGSVWATGKNDYGQLGVGKTEDELAKTATFMPCVDDTGAEIKDAIDIACGWKHTAVIRTGGALWQCGKNDCGQLGTGESGTDVKSTKFVQSQDASGAITDAEAVACGQSHTAVIRAGGQLWQCGKNETGQLGTGESGSGVKSTKFVQSEDASGAITDAEAVACGAAHTAVIRAGGALWQCGDNKTGQLGTGESGSSKNKTKFVQSEDASGAITDAEAVACGQSHTAVIRAGGQLWQCGYNNNGQLGTGDNVDVNKFVQSEDASGAITDVEAVSCGSQHTAVIRAGGALWQCGKNDCGQLGTGESGTDTNKTKFVQSQDTNGTITNVAAVSNGCYAYATLILRPDANGDLELLGTGSNTSGELGLGEDDANAYTNQTKFVKAMVIEMPTILTTVGQSKSRNVTGVGEFQGATSITITWGDLTYDYNAKWDPATQTWVQKGDTPFWKASTDGADKISVTNDSSKAYSVTLSFAVDNAYAASDENGTAVEGSFVTTSFGDTAVENNTLKLPVAAKDVTAYLKLSGMSDKVTGVESLQNQTFGVVTATLAEAQ